MSTDQIVTQSLRGVVYGMAKLGLAVVGERVDNAFACYDGRITLKE